ncbi:MAG: hypothetical protein ACK50N_02835 [Flavobacteriales bacterium]|jgi:hypothetical protein
MREIGLLIMVVLGLSCKKDEPDPIAPILTYVSTSDTEVQSFNNQVRVVFSYEDFQGDLGNEDPDILSLKVKDARLEEADFYHIPPMTPNSEELRIKGNYEVVLNTMFLLGNGASETTKFSIQLRDRAGNWSNTIETSVITITP